MVKLTSKMGKTKKNKVIEEILEHKREWESYWNENRERYIDDNEFLHVSQFTDQERRFYKRDKRPCLEFNLLNNHVNQIVAEFSASKFSPDLYPIDAMNLGDNAEQNMKLREDLLELIYHQSKVNLIHGRAFKQVIKGGYGASRVCVESDPNNPFQQIINLKPIHKPDRVGFDPLARTITKQDGRFCYVISTKAKDWLKNKYPRIDWDNVDSCPTLYDDDWVTDDGINVIDYWEKVPSKVEAVQLSTGQFIDISNDESSQLNEIEMQNLSLGMENAPLQFDRTLRNGSTSSIQVIKRGKVTRDIIHFYRITCNEIVEHTIWDGSLLPCVMWVGQSDYVGQKEKTTSFIRYARDPQRAINMINNEILNYLKNLRNEKILSPAECIAPYKDIYANPSQHRGVLPYKPVVLNSVLLKPERLGTDEIPQSVLVAVNNFFGYINETLGRFDAAIGKDSQAVSGVAILNRQMASNLSATTYFNNARESIEAEAQIILDLMPKIYDNTRQLSIPNEEKGNRTMMINKLDDTASDITLGKFSIIIRVGSSFRIQREQNYQKLVQYLQLDPAALPYLRDYIIKNSNIDDAASMIDRLREGGLIPPEIILAESSDPKEKAKAFQRLQQATQQKQMQQQLTMRAFEQKMQNETVIADSEKTRALADLNSKMMDSQTKRMEAMSKGVLESHKIQAEQARTNAQLQESAWKLAKEAGQASERPLF